jgi:uncharacterized cupredoxin-like copper-binding protein
MPKHFRTIKIIVPLILIAVFLLSACGGGSSASKTPVDVNITLTDFGISSSLTTFQVGTPYHFTVKNDGAVPHEIFIMPVATAGMTPDQIQALKGSGLDSIMADDLPVGATKTMDYTFTKAYPAGTLEFACHLPGHYEAGMHLPITVQ